ncbi:MAG: hypothetical protein ACRD3Q_22175, partial [Terriglobales bacterium]
MRTWLQRLGLVVVVCGSVPGVGAPQRPSERPRRERPQHERPERRHEPRDHGPGQTSTPQQQPRNTPPPAPAIAPAETPAQPTASQQLQESPAVPPQVTFENGQLSISAPNSNLSDVLNAVKAKTGANLELPANAAQERVAVELGPGPPRDVLAKLLDGSPFDYILLGSPTQPNALTQILITPANANGAPSSPPPAMGSQRAEAPAEPGEEEPPNNEAPAPTQAQQPPPATPGATMPAEQNAPPETTPNTQPAQGNQGNQVKTPEQLLQ